LAKRSAIKETDVAAAVVRWLTEMGWEVYQEVSLGAGARTIDLVATRDRLVWAIECKVSFGVPVLAQAYGLLGLAHYVSVATSDASDGDGGTNRWFAKLVAEEHGIGTFEVGERFNDRGVMDGWVATREVEPRLYRKVGRIVTWGAKNLHGRIIPKDERGERLYPYLRELLTEAQKTYAAAGNNKGKRWSPWRQTCEEVLRYVRLWPGCSPAACLRMVPHHYQTEATARGSMVTWVRAGKVPGVEERREGRLIQWWPKEA
jgi:hypothetical protein